jgi:hypothetical protein
VRKSSKITLIFVFLFSLVISANAAESVRIPLDSNSSTIANDLWHPDYGELDVDIADELAAAGEDLAKLDPVESTLWHKSENYHEQKAKDEVTDFNADSKFSYNGVISSPQGLMRFVIADDNNNKFQVHLSKELHTILLRKNLMRKLGYQIPGMKYLKEITIHFNSEKEKTFFKDVELVGEVASAPSRWVVRETETSLVLQDIFIKELDYTSVDIALTMLPLSLESRALRGAVVPYNITLMGESINKLSFKSVNRVDGHLLMEHGTSADFQTSMDDLAWASNKLEKLTRADFKEVVADAYYPEVVSKILVEKLISRRNHLVCTLNEKCSEIPYVKEIDHKHVKKGFLEKEEFEGYASRFSHGAKKGPLDNLWYYLLTESQATLIGTVMDEVNTYLRVFDLAEARMDWMKNDFEKYKDYALDYFDKNGVFPTLPVQSWVAPMLNANLILGRDIVIGTSLGTDNFVQLADSTGIAVSLGAYVGLERALTQLTSGNILPNIGIQVNYTHVKPIVSLKESLKEPYKNMFVNFLTKRLKEKLETINSNEKISADERKDTINDLFSEISKDLGVGESLIITHSIVPDVSLTLKGPIYTGPNISGTVGAKNKQLKRTQVYRKSRHEFQVYIDDGNIKEFYKRLGLSYYVPLFTGESKSVFGQMNVDMYTLNLNPNTKDNPDFYKNVTVLLSLLKDRDYIADQVKPYNIQSEISDKASRFSILFFMHSIVKRFHKFVVNFPGLEKTKYVTADYGSQTGFNLKNFGKDVANYILGELMADMDFQFGFDKNPYENAGRSMYGSSRTNNTNFEGKINAYSANLHIDNMDEKYAVTTFRYENGEISQRRLWKELKKVNKEFGKEIYEEADAQDAGYLTYLKLDTKVHLYDKAVDKLINLTLSDFDNLEEKVKRSRRLPMKCRGMRGSRYSRTVMTRQKKLECAEFDILYRQQKSCMKNYEVGKWKKANRCIAKYINEITNSLGFDVLSDLVGEDNIYLESQFNGFRRNHEYLYIPINGRSFGRRNSIYKSGPVSSIQKFLGILGGELHGTWYRTKVL